MKILIISDSHGNIQNLRHVLGFAKKIKCGAVIHCGDWNNLESVNTVINFNIPLYTVIGNADIADNIKYKYKKYLEIKIDNKKILIIHKYHIPTSKFQIPDIIFTGHYHSQKMWEENGITIVRPGALENSINFAVYDTISGKVEFINEQT